MNPCKSHWSCREKRLEDERMISHPHTRRVKQIAVLDSVQPSQSNIQTELDLTLACVIVCCMLAGPLPVYVCRFGSRPGRSHGRAAHGAHRRAGTILYHRCCGGCWRSSWRVCGQPACFEAAEHQAQGAVSTSCPGVSKSVSVAPSLLWWMLATLASSWCALRHSTCTAADTAQIKHKEL
jgi:hypothetical protein